MSLSSSKRSPTTNRTAHPRNWAVALIAIHVVAVGLIMCLTGTSRSKHTTEMAVRALGDTFEYVAGTLEPGENDDPHRLQDTLGQLNHSERWDVLRVVAFDGEIVGSLDRSQVGTKHWQIEDLIRSWPTALTIERQDPHNEILGRVVYRAPISTAGTQGRNRLMLEGVVGLARLMPPAAPFNGLAIAILVASLIVQVALCVVAWPRFRPLIRLGRNLMRNEHRLRQEISSLRLANETGPLARVWNHLITLFEEMRDTAGKANAVRELSNALERNSSTAFIEATHIVPEGIMHVTGGERISYANKMACRLLGLAAPGDQESFESTESVPAAEAVLATSGVSPLGRKIVDAITAAKSKEQFESKSTTVEGEGDSVFRVRVLPIRREGCTGDAYILITDISQLAQAEKAREEFMSHVAHELRTPLTNIQAYAETYAEFDDPQVRTECFNVINKETRRLTRLVEEMLSTTKLELGSVTVKRDDVDLLVLLGEAVRDLSATAQERDIALSTDLPSKLPTLQADRDKLAVVINNLLGNALKYTNPGGSVVLRCRLKDASVCIDFVDSGIGIAAEDQASIFERLYRVDSEEVRSRTGTGIGLATAKEIVRAHRGDIHLSSSLGQGSTFTVELPVTRELVETGV